MPAIDTPITTEVLVAFQRAWQSTTEDYAQRRINSEHTLQACLYHHLRPLVPPSYSVFTEAVIRLPEDVAIEAGKRKVIVDLLITRDTELIAAIELKYAPRGQPTIESVRKDVLSLSRVNSRRNLSDRVSIEMPRFRSDDADALELTVSPQRKLIFALYCKSEIERFTQTMFWVTFKPTDGYWNDSVSHPKNLGIAVASTNRAGGAHCIYFGGPFDRLGSAGAGDA